MEPNTQLLANSLVTGSVYALFALGYSLTFGVTRAFNFAHPVVFGVGAVVAAVVVEAGHPLLPAVVAGTVAGGLTGIAVDRIAFFPLRKRASEPGMQLVAGAALLTAFAGLAAAFFGRAAIAFPAASLRTPPLRVGGAVVSGLQVETIAAAVVAIAAVFFIARKTRLGDAMRAVAVEPAAAQTAGINVEAIVALTAFLSSGLGALSGIAFFALHPPAAPIAPDAFVLAALAAAMVSGLGSPAGAVAAVYAIAFAQIALHGQRPAVATEIIPLAVIAAAAIIAPNGVSRVRALRTS